MCLDNIFTVFSVLPTACAIVRSVGTPSSDARHVPSPGFTFPKRVVGNKQKRERSCLMKWFREYTWLHYVNEHDVVLCFICSKAHAQSKHYNKIFYILVSCILVTNLLVYSGF